jgi:hypothetical protein
MLVCVTLRLLLLALRFNWSNPDGMSAVGCAAVSEGAGKAGGEKRGEKREKSDAFVARLTRTITEEIHQLVPERDKDDDFVPPCLQGSMSEAYDRTKQALVRVLDAIDSERLRSDNVSQAMHDNLEEAVRQQVIFLPRYALFRFTRMPNVSHAL